MYFVISISNIDINFVYRLYGLNVEYLFGFFDLRRVKSVSNVRDTEDKCREQSNRSAKSKLTKYTIIGVSKSIHSARSYLETSPSFFFVGRTTKNSISLH